jgi:hypothetical protein
MASAATTIKRNNNPSPMYDLTSSPDTYRPRSDFTNVSHFLH